VVGSGGGSNDSGQGMLLYGKVGHRSYNLVMHIVIRFSSQQQKNRCNVLRCKVSMGFYGFSLGVNYCVPITTPYIVKL